MSTNSVILNNFVWLTYSVLNVKNIEKMMNFQYINETLVAE